MAKIPLKRHKKPDTQLPVVNLSFRSKLSNIEKVPRDIRRA